MKNTWTNRLFFLYISPETEGLPMPVIILDDKNGISLPAELMERLGLTPGSRLSVEADGEGRLLLTPLHASAPASARAHA